MSHLRPCLLEAGVPENQLTEWTSHCFRRGSGIDILEAHGVSAMLSHGGWSHPRAAEPYATADEQHAVGLASAARLMIDDSDDEV